jgi:hypothetical protein
MLLHREDMPPGKQMQLSALKYSLVLLIVIPGRPALAENPGFVLFRSEDRTRESLFLPPPPEGRTPAAGQNFPRVNSGVPAPGTTVKAPNTAQYVPLTDREKWRYYWYSTYGPVAFLRVTAASGIDQARDDNPEWGQGMEGYGKRFASKFGHRIVKRSIHHGLAALLKEDPRYIRADREGFFPRAFYAASRTFITRTDAGGERFATSQITGIFAGSFISRTWHPESDRSSRAALESAVFSLGVNMALNGLKEFWPDVRRLIQRK